MGSFGFFFCFFFINARFHVHLILIVKGGVLSFFFVFVHIELSGRLSADISPRVSVCDVFFKRYLSHDTDCPRLCHREQERGSDRI